jgi:hypothetical protein
MPYEWRRDRENNGLALGMVWRVPPDEPADAQYNCATGASQWLDRAKMGARLGDGGRRVFGPSRARLKAAPREYCWCWNSTGQPTALARARARASRAAEAARLEPRDRGSKRAREARPQWLDQETRRDSRLFAVDAGLELEALRAKYPDRGRYALVRGQVRPTRVSEKTWKVEGYVAGLSIDSINVPHGLRGMLGRIAEIVDADKREREPYEATVAFGKRSALDVEAVK